QATAAPAKRRAPRRASGKTPGNAGEDADKDAGKDGKAGGKGAGRAAKRGGDAADAADEEFEVTEVEAADTPTDLDDQSTAMGDSVHTYLKAIGRRQLLTAEQEVELAKRIEAGLYAEHKLENEDLSPDLRADLEWI